MSRAGFVLVGGKSSRMGRDKALLPFRNTTLAQHLARLVEAAAGSAALVGEPAKYRTLGFPVIADALPGCGPLGGIFSALQASPADWNLILACDMPGITSEFLSELLRRAEQSGADAFLVEGPSGRLEPLCAVYHRRITGAIARALEQNTRKVLDGLRGLNLQTWPVAEPLWLENVNTPQEWIDAAGRRLV